jgi:hypothetical protein
LAAGIGSSDSRLGFAAGLGDGSPTKVCVDPATLFGLSAAATLDGRDLSTKRASSSSDVVSKNRRSAAGFVAGCFDFLFSFAFLKLLSALFSATII